MKILNVNSYYFSSSLYRPMEEALIRRGCDITTYVPLGRNYRIRDECKYEENPNYLDISECYHRYARVIFHLKHSRIKKDFLNRYDFNNYDILHAHSLFSNGYIAYTAYKKYRTPYIVAVRSADIYTFFEKMFYLRRLGIDILLNASAIIFLSKAHRDYCTETFIPEIYKEALAKKIKVIPNGINRFWLENKVSQPKEIDAQNVKLVFAGAIDKRKNLQTVFKACEILIQRGYKINFTVVGKILNNAIRRELEKYPFVHYVGRVGKEDLLQYYRQDDIFVMPSKKETFGLVYPEAMSQGLPVIYTKGQGFDGQFEEGVVGYAVTATDAAGIADRILQIYEHYDEIVKNCLNLVDQFDWEHIGKEYINTYRESMGF